MKDKEGAGYTYMRVHLSPCGRVQLFVTPWTAAHQAPVLGHTPARTLGWVARDLPDPGIKPTSPLSPALQVDSSPLSPRGRPLYTHTGV